MSRKLRVAILGASGYTGADLVRLLANHPKVEIALLTAERKAGLPLGKVFPHLGHLDLPDLMAVNEVEWPGVELDVVFCALPHGTTQEIVKGLMHATDHTIVDEVIADHPEDRTNEIAAQVKVIDLSADFRLRDPDVYEEWYGHAHFAPKLQAQAVYGLTELHRDKIRQASLVACPGCYPTAAILALAPLLEAKAIDPAEIIIDAKSGVTGAGRSLKEANLFTEVAEGLKPYGVSRHRHMPEIEQELGGHAGEGIGLSFTPHLVPMNRGELETIYVRLKGSKTAADLRDLLVKRYKNEPFVRVLDEGEIPTTHHVRGSNHCVLNVFEDRIKGRAIVISAIDNLVKGSSGQAIQNMNVMFGLDETLGLTAAPLFP